MIAGDPHYSHCNSEFQIKGVDMPALGALYLDHTTAIRDLIKESFVAVLTFFNYFDMGDLRWGWRNATSVDTLIHILRSS